MFLKPCKSLALVSRGLSLCRQFVKCYSSYQATAIEYTLTPHLELTNVTLLRDLCLIPRGYMLLTCTLVRSHTVSRAAHVHIEIDVETGRQSLTI